jgi:hypothetical protein
MTSAERWRAALCRVDEVCGLLESGSADAFESCLPLLECARALLNGPAAPASLGGALPRTLAVKLAAAARLAREATVFYLGCCPAGPPGARAYNRCGMPLADPPALRTLAAI